MKHIKRQVYELLDLPERAWSLSWWVDVFIIVLIVLNVAALLLESVRPLQERYGAEFAWFEAFSVAVFTVEYILRVWTANLHPDYSAPIRGRLRFMATPMAIIDLLAFLPFYLPLLGVDMRMLRILRTLRLFRLLKIARYVKALSIIGDVFRKKWEELAISLMLTILLLLVASTMMYYVENEAQPDVFASIPDTMWWGIATLTTVGYGDVYPITPLGRLLGGIIAIIGIGLFALPTGILASGFTEELAKAKNKDGYCPTCGQKLPHD